MGGSSFVPLVFLGISALKQRNSSKVPFGKPFLVLLGIRIRNYGVLLWFAVTTEGMVSVGSIFPCPRKRKNELEKGQDKPKTLPAKKKKKKELELTVKVPTPTMCIGVTLVIIPKNFMGIKPMA